MSAGLGWARKHLASSSMASSHWTVAGNTRSSSRRTASRTAWSTVTPHSLTIFACCTWSATIPRAAIHVIQDLARGQTTYTKWTGNTGGCQHEGNGNATTSSVTRRRARSFGCTKLPVLHTDDWPKTMGYRAATLRASYTGKFGSDRRWLHRGEKSGNGRLPRNESNQWQTLCRKDDRDAEKP